MAENSVCIDWLSFTAPHRSQLPGVIVPPWEESINGQADIGRFGYRKALRFHSGLIVMYDGSTPTMGQHFIYSGRAIMNSIANNNDGGLSILDWHNSQGHKCTRIDLAIDVPDGQELIETISKMAETRSFRGTAHTATTIRSSDGEGLTIYVGSRISERFVRVYNKSAQLGQQGHWTRIEVEIKGDSARAVARAILGAGNGGLDMVARSVISRVCTFDCPSWQKVFEGETLTIGTPKIEEKATEEWLLGQVVAALVKFERQNPDKQIIQRFWDKVEMLLDSDTRAQDAR